ncbi:3'(2'),5'-bisphosphate nucleotidase CysQ [Rhizobium albus]|nr:3'(2'),5'-bisphosphate nucleotidase CysQ [Rhizobium albus]
MGETKDIDHAAVLATMREAAQAAGTVLVSIFAQGYEIRSKSDGSPVTEADTAAELLILADLRAHFPEIPIVAEEAAAAGVLPADLGQRFFLVDPLDGTREFVSGRAEFTVNIALIEHGSPTVGVVVAPALGQTYYGSDAGAYHVDDKAERTTQLMATSSSDGPVAVASRSHRDPDTNAYLARRDITNCVSIGSSLKFCLLAEGKADIYPRFSRTMEWDTAAGDAVLRAAGGRTTLADEVTPLTYGKRPEKREDDPQGFTAPFANPPFIAFGRGRPARI